MSFILDALRKSENERQQSSVRRISDMPTVVHRNKVPLWMLGIIIGLTAGIFLLGWAWLNDVNTRNQEEGIITENILDPSPQVGLTHTPTSSSVGPENIPGVTNRIRSTRIPIRTSYNSRKFFSRIGVNTSRLSA